MGRGAPPVYALARPLGHPAPDPVDPSRRCGSLLVVASDRFPFETSCPVVLQVPVARAGRVVRELRVHRCPAGEASAVPLER